MQMAVTFRPLQHTDAALLQRLYHDARLMRFIANPCDIDLQSLLNSMVDAMAKPKPTFCYWVVEQMGQPLGLVSATQIHWQHRHAELGIMLLPCFQGKGIAKQVFSQLITRMFQQDLDCLYSRMLTTNLPAQRLVRQCGMVPCGAPYDAAQGMYWVKREHPAVAK